MNTNIDRRNKRPTIRDVAALAGVSTATVSYVLNGKDSVSEPTAERVRECVASLGYRANSLAVAHRTGRSKTVGLAVPDLTNPFFPEFAQGVHDAAAKAGFAVLLVDLYGSAAGEVESIEGLADRSPDGLIWCAVGEELAHFDFPTVLFDRQVEGFDSVQADIHQGGVLQADYLTVYGHRRIGILSGPEWSDTAQTRRSGVIESLPSSVDVVWDLALDYTAHIPPDIANAILDADVTCVVTANDIQAIGLLQLYRSAGLAVPDDVSVIGFDDIDLARLVNPALTTVHLPIGQLGARSFEILSDRIDNPNAPVRREQLPVTMVERGSLRRR